MSRVLRVVGVAVLAGGLAGCFWPAPGHDPDRTAFNDLETTLVPGNVGQLTQRWVWSAPGSGRVRAPVASTAGIHVITGDCQLETINAITGALSWNFDLGNYPDIGPGWCSITTVGDPFVADGRVWVGRQGLFIKQPPSPVTYLNVATLGFELDGTPAVEWKGGLLDNLRGGLAEGVSGSIISTPLPPPFPPIPNFSFVPSMVAGELGTGWHSVGIPAESAGSSLGGRTLGTSALYDSGLGPLATVPGDTTSGNGLRAFALTGATPGCSTGSAGFDCPIWATALDGTNAWQPVIGEDGTTVYTGTDAGTVYAIDAATGAVRWSAPVGSAVTGSVALAGDTLYVPTASGDLVAVAAHGCGAGTCAPLWSGATGSSISQQPAVAGTVVYTASADGSLHAFAASGCGGDTTCPALWTEATGRQLSDAPIVSNGMLYVTFNDDTAHGGLLAYGLPA